MGDQTTLLVTGDLHIGRFPSHVPASDSALSVEAVWRAAVNLAIAERVDAVILTGDVADEDNLFEAISPLRQGVNRLWRAGIRTVAVTGNHDFDVLRRLSGLVADDLGPEALTLLGARGTWGETMIEKDGTPALRLMGWSFPARHVRESPLETFTMEPASVPTLGIVHGDLDVAQSRYAPLSRVALSASGADGWLLGHIHRPSQSDAGSTPVLYPGSLQPLDPGETGAHGPWLVSVDPGGALDARQRPLATVRYDALTVDLSEAENSADVELALDRAIRECLREVADEQPTAMRVVLNLSLTGRSAAFSAVDEITDKLRNQDFENGGATASIRRIASGVRPQHDLTALALRSDPAGTVAETLLDLEAGGDANGLLADAVRSLRGLDGASAFTPLAHPSSGLNSPPGEGALSPEEEARKRLLAQGFRLLDSLRTQVPTN